MDREEKRKQDTAPLGQQERERERSERSEKSQESVVKMLLKVAGSAKAESGGEALKCSRGRFSGNQKEGKKKEDGVDRDVFKGARGESTRMRQGGKEDEDLGLRSRGDSRTDLETSVRRQVEGL